jgi:hypothetical protein
MTTKQLGFMAILTFGTLATVQVASLWGLYAELLTFDGYLSLWAPIMTLMVGFWFGQQRQGLGD